MDIAQRPPVIELRRREIADVPQETEPDARDAARLRRRLARVPAAPPIDERRDSDDVVARPLRQRGGCEAEDRYARFRREDDSIVADKLVFAIAAHGFEPADGDLLQRKERILAE